MPQLVIHVFIDDIEDPNTELSISLDQLSNAFAVGSLAVDDFEHVAYPLIDDRGFQIGYVELVDS